MPILLIFNIKKLCKITDKFVRYLTIFRNLQVPMITVESSSASGDPLRPMFKILVKLFVDVCKVCSFVYSEFPLFRYEYEIVIFNLSILSMDLV